MRKLAIMFLLLAALLYLSPEAYAVGISGPYKPNYLFEPNMDINLTYVVVNSANSLLNISLGVDVDGAYCCGPEAEREDKLIVANATTYPKMVQLESSQKATFFVSIKFPGKMDVPGLHALLVAATETPPEGGGLAAAASVRTPIFFFVRFPGKYIEVSMEAPDVEAEKTQVVPIKVINRGTLGIDNVYATITILDIHNKTITTLYSNTTNLPRDQTKVLEASWNTTGQSEGAYYVKADINYDGFIKNISDEFKIGTLSLQIVNYTKEVFADEINPFSIQVESRWNEVINGVFVIVDLKKNSQVVASFQTPTTDVPAWSTKTLTGYFNANIPPDSYDMDIYLHYQGKSTSAQDILSVVKKRLLIRQILSPFIIFVVLLVVNLALWYFIWKRRNKPPQSGIQATEAVK